MATQPLNLNQAIVAKLTDKGMKTFSDAVYESTGKFRAPPVDENGIIKMRLLEFIKIFGAEIDGGVIEGPPHLVVAEEAAGEKSPDPKEIKTAPNK